MTSNPPEADPTLLEKNLGVSVPSQEAPASPDPSQNAVVKAAFADAMCQQTLEKRGRQRTECQEPIETCTKRLQSKDGTKDDDGGSLKRKLAVIWDEDNTSNEKDRLEALKSTRELLSTFFNELIQDGVQAHIDREELKQQLKVSEQQCSAKAREIERLRASEKKARESISNLLRAVDSSNEEARDQCQAKLVEARLRADLLHVAASRDEMKGELASAQRRCKLLGDDLTDTKAKLSKVQQEKIQLERDQQATMSLANALQGNAHSDVDYYKRKVTELNTHIHGLSAMLTEKNRQIESLRREKERFMSQNRLASYRADGERKKRVSY